MIHLAGDGHPGPALSVLDIVTALYFKAMRVNPAEPQWEERDRFILSKGHACPALYAALARRGFFSPEVLPSLRRLGSILQGHPDMKKTPGIDSTSGSLGNGISIGLGMALAARVNRRDYYTYVIVGDGEIQEGIVWEAAMAAVHYRAGRLIVFVDHNGQQSGGPVGEVSGLYPVLPKWEAFGWHCQEIDGHDLRAILTAIDRAQAEEARPSCIVARTVKGKGIPFMEADNSWHKRVPTKDELNAALAVLA
jgi:transketolase